MLKTSPLIPLILISLLLSACNFPTSQKPTQISTPPADSLVDAYPVDPIFKEFYDHLGGEAVLGPAISPLTELGNLRVQYVEAALMSLDPLAIESERYKLEPLGIFLGISEPAITNPGLPDEQFINGHLIYEEFVPFYHQLGGARFVGRPLTEARHNPEKGRIEQYFENLGFYRSLDDPTGTVRLLAYGAYTCNLRCRSLPPTASIPSLHGFLPQPFDSIVAQQGLDFIGLTLTEPYLAEDGKMEVIFENMVMVFEPGKERSQIGDGLYLKVWLPQVLFNRGPAKPEEGQKGYSTSIWLPIVIRVGPGESMAEIIRVESPLWVPLILNGSNEKQYTVSLRPIVEMLGKQRQPPVEKRDDPLMVFYPVEGTNGYHVPIYFDEYIQRHNGIRWIGMPITETFQVGAGIFRQCFTNLCLDFDTKAQGSGRLRPAPFGTEYKEKFYQGPGTNPKSGQSDGVTMVVQESQPYVLPLESPQIKVTLTRNGFPWPNQVPILTLTLPDNNQQFYQMDPTDEHGETFIRLPAVDAPYGTLLLYKVCLPLIDEEQLCVDDHYVIWGK